MDVKWKSSDLEKYLSAKEYIDTVILPLQAFQITDDATLETDAFLAEVLSIYTNELEKELSGRVLLAPTYTYVKSTELEQEVDRVNVWVQEMVKQPFSSVFLVTFDSTWKKVEQSLDGNLLWFPGMKPTDLRSEETIKMIRSQVEQISDLIRSYW